MSGRSGVGGSELIAFPLIERVTIAGYSLYPGQKGVLDIEFGEGPWLVLGVNGLGKSTLLLVMRYLLSGAVRTRAAGFAGERDDLQSVDSRIFAVRVADGGQNATASIRVRISDSTLFVERALSNLKILRASIEESAGSRDLTSEDEYRSAITALVGVAQFEDVVRILDHLMFYLEARQTLAWDGAAQFELFRALLTPNLSAELRRLEGAIVSADSTARNLNATLYKITRRREREAVKKVNANETRARIAAVRGEVDALDNEEVNINRELGVAQERRLDNRLQLKRGEQDVDNAAQAYEKHKFEVLRQAFATVKPTEEYIFLKMLSDQICIACDQPAADAAAELQSRSDLGRCLICGSPPKVMENVESVSDALKTKSAEAFGLLESKRDALKTYREQYSMSNGEVERLKERLSQHRQSVEEKEDVIRRLRKNLPADENLEMGREEDRIATLRREVQNFRHEREIAERSIDELLEELKRATEKVRESLEAAFNDEAARFFSESVRLVYAPRVAKIGQGGRSFEFPAFEVEMTSGTTLGQFVRRTPGQVSLSQREYIELIFRIVILKFMGREEGTLVVDGPEGSLDAVFARRAGDLFSGFTKDSRVNVVLACNIIEGGFIPHCLDGYGEADRLNRVVNLLEHAAPTQALTNLRPEYMANVEKILASEPAR